MSSYPKASTVSVELFEHVGPKKGCTHLKHMLGLIRPRAFAKMWLLSQSNSSAGANRSETFLRTIT